MCRRFKKPSNRCAEKSPGVVPLNSSSSNVHPSNNIPHALIYLLLFVYHLFNVISMRDIAFLAFS